MTVSKTRRSVLSSCRPTLSHQLLISLCWWRPPGRTASPHSGRPTPPQAVFVNRGQWPGAAGAGLRPSGLEGRQGTSLRPRAAAKCRLDGRAESLSPSVASNPRPLGEVGFQRARTTQGFLTRATTSTRKVLKCRHLAWWQISFMTPSHPHSPPPDLAVFRMCDDLLPRGRRAHTQLAW